MLIFVKKRARIHASNIIPFESYTTAYDENDKKLIFISLSKIRAEDHCTSIHNIYINLRNSKYI